MRTSSYVKARKSRSAPINLILVSLLGANGVAVVALSDRMDRWVPSSLYEADALLVTHRAAGPPVAPKVVETAAVEPNIEPVTAPASFGVSEPAERVTPAKAPVPVVKTRVSVEWAFADLKYAPVQTADLDAPSVAGSLAAEELGETATVISAPEQLAASQAATSLEDALMSVIATPAPILALPEMEPAADPSAGPQIDDYSAGEAAATQGPAADSGAQPLPALPDAGAAKLG